MTDHDPIRRLAQALLARPDDSACATILDQLDAYVAAQIEGAGYAASQPDVAWHLDSCVECAEAYALLYEARLAELRAPDPTSIPAPNLSFLPSAPYQPSSEQPQSPTSLRAAIEAAVERVGGSLRLRFSRALLDLLPPPSGPALALRAGAEAGAPLFDLELDAPAEPLERLQLTAYRQAAQPGRYALRVRLKLRGRDWPDLAQVPVLLVLGDERRHALTDPWGEAVFEEVPEPMLPEMQIEVTG